MRGLVYSAVFVVLLLVGFLVTPGLVRLINAEYWVAVAEYGPKASALTDEILSIDQKINLQRRQVSDLEVNISTLRDQREAEVAGAKSASGQPGIGPRAAALTVDISRLAEERDKQQKTLTLLSDQRDSLDKSRKEVNAIIEKAGADSVNLYLVARALALGAIGALMSIMVKFELAASITKGGESHSWFDEHSLPKLWTSTAIGAIVAVVALGLFHTKQITIFSGSEAASSQPEFWRVTILCLMAGAFSDRLFQAASKRVDVYIGEESKPRQTDGSAESFRADRKRKKSRVVRTRFKRTKPALVDINKEPAITAQQS